MFLIVLANIFMNGNKWGDFWNSKGSFSVQNMVYDFWESPTRSPFFCNAHMYQKIQKCAQIFMHQNFYFF